MPTEPHVLTSPPPTADSGPSDAFLIAGLIGGDAAALGALIRRYDGLVRYAIFRLSVQECRRDPDWVDSVASATWAGFVRSMQRAGSHPPASAKAYLARIAHNQTISARRAASTGEAAGLSIHGDEGSLDIASEAEEPVEVLSGLESLESLKACLASLEQDDRTLVSQLPAITERRWRDAAAALGMSESTLRSRWKGALGRLRACVDGKTGKRLAPGRQTGD